MEQLYSRRQEHKHAIFQITLEAHCHCERPAFNQYARAST